MRLKGKVEIDEMNGVHSMMGIVSLCNVKLNIYCYIVDGVMIDTGAKSLQKEFEPFFQKEDFEQVWITHNHEDHTGGAASIQRNHNIPIYIHKMSVEDTKAIANYPLYRQQFWGIRESFQSLPFSTTMNSRNATWDIIETPGHSKDHLAFLNRQTGQLFTGDLYVNPKTKVIMQDESISTIIESLGKVLTYEFEDVFCQHAGYVKNGREMLLQKKEYLEELQDEVLKFHRKGYKDLEIQQQLFPKNYPIISLSLGEWDSLHIIRSVIKETNNKP